MIRRLFTLLLLICGVSSLVGQPNCNLYKSDSTCYLACLETEKAVERYSGSAPFQEHLLEAITLCPTFHHAYFELSVNYAKRGLLHDWKNLIDKAVEISPVDHLGWRGWYHWFFANNYERAIADIDQLDGLVAYDLGTTGDGLYHLNILKALCYKGLGNTQKALSLIQACMNSEEYYQGSYDYLHLGVLLLEAGETEKALETLAAQNSFNEISEAYFYSSKAYLLLGEKTKAVDLLDTALQAYDKGMAMHDPYRQLPDEIYRSTIEKELEMLISKE